MPRDGGPRDTGRARGDTRVQDHIRALDSDPGEWLPIRDAARALGCSVTTVRSRHKRGEIRRRQDGPRHLYHVAPGDAREPELTPARQALLAIKHQRPYDEIASHFRDFGSADLLEFHGGLLVGVLTLEIDPGMAATAAKLGALVDRAAARRREIAGLPQVIEVERAPAAPVEGVELVDPSDDVHPESSTG